MYNDKYFVVDMTSCSTTGEIINSISLALETLDNSGQNIILKLSNNNLNQSQLLSIQSLITSYGCILDTIETCNENTAMIAGNMNINVTRTPEVTETKEVNLTGFEPFSLNKPENDNSIAIKDVQGLHFEADLDKIQEKQDNINIKSDLAQVGITSSSNFSDIEKQISSKYSTAEEIISEPSSISLMSEPVIQGYSIPQETESEMENLEKNSIGVYKKAYDEEQNDESMWENVDFYETPTSDPIISDTKNTTYINQTLRSGQLLEADGNVVVIGDCHPGSEIRAIGDITVWGVLSGIAHAGCKGNTEAKVRALKLNAVQLRIANCYSRRPDGTNIPYIIRSSVFTPEEARVVNNEIMLFKINQN